ncbi:MAG: NAD(P)-binding domain-containing protein [Phycisphaerales bacterium]
MRPDGEKSGKISVMEALPCPLEPCLSTDALRGRRVAVVGFGNQGRAHALNLRDSGIDIRVAGRPGSDARGRAASDGFATLDTRMAAGQSDLVILALPDEVHAEVWAHDVAPVIQPGQVAGFIHGSSIHFGLVRPAAGIGIVMVAPKGPGTTLRARTAGRPLA